MSNNFKCDNSVIVNQSKFFICIWIYTIGIFEVLAKHKGIQEWKSHYVGPQRSQCLDKCSVENLLMFCVY